MATMMYNKEYNHIDFRNVEDVINADTVQIRKGGAINIEGVIPTTNEHFLGVSLYDTDVGNMVSVAKYGNTVPVLITAGQTVSIGSPLKLHLPDGDFMVASSTEKAHALALEAVTTGVGEEAIIPALLKYMVVD